MKVIYLAHPLSDDPVRNQLNAARWGIWIAKTFGCAVSADWIWWSQVLDETPENRALGLAADKAMVSRCDELWLTGGRVSSGMAVELEQAQACGKMIRDLTKYGYRDPSFHGEARLREFVEQVKREWTVPSDVLQQLQEQVR